MSSIVILIIAALAVILAVGLAYVPLRLLLAHLSRNIREFIQRQRERRTVNRVTPDRRKVAPPNL
jgi:type II secretory pathway pseudopilin PulG